MKKLIVILLAAAMILSLAACAKKGPDLTVKRGKDGLWDITGTWKIIDQVDADDSKADENDRFTFYPDGTVYSTVTGNTHTYEVQGLMVEQDGVLFGLTVDGDTMTWTVGSACVTYQRIALLSAE